MKPEPRDGRTASRAWRRDESPPSRKETADDPRARDMSALNRAWTRHQPQVYRYAYHLLGDGEAADEVAQETFMWAWSSGAFRRPDRPLRARLLRHCGELCRRMAGARAPQYAPAAKPLPADPLRAALQSLSFEHRALIVLSEIENLDRREIAEVLGCPALWVPLRLRRAQDRLTRAVCSAHHA